MSYEGVEKIYEYFVPHHHSTENPVIQNLTEIEILTEEKNKIKSAVITDFILSIEIIIIALGTVLEKPIVTQIIVVSIIAIIATVGVYGIVALIVRMDDFGFILSKKQNSTSQFIGNLLIQALPKVIQSLAFIGTVALLLVSGGIFKHNIAYLHHFLDSLPSIVSEFILGLLFGVLALIMVGAFKFIIKKIK